MNLVVNGEERSVPDHLTVRQLLEHLGFRPERVAVEVNRAVVKRAEHGTRALKTGDAVEVVSFVGGG